MASEALWKAVVFTRQREGQLCPAKQAVDRHPGPSAMRDKAADQWAKKA